MGDRYFVRAGADRGTPFATFRAAPEMSARDRRTRGGRRPAARRGVSGLDAQE